MKCIALFKLVQQTLEHDASIQMRLLCKSMGEISSDLRINNNRLQIFLNGLQIIFAVDHKIEMRSRSKLNRVRHVITVMSQIKLKALRCARVCPKNKKK